MITSAHDRSLLDLLAELGRASRGLKQGEVFCSGITFTQFFILDQVSRRDEGLPLSDLHEILAVEKSTTTRLMAPLLEQGLVERKPCCTDSRNRVLWLTVGGRETLEVVWSCISEVLGAIDAELPEENREQIYSSVQTFLEVLRLVCSPKCCKERA